jgi:serine O-acetyltransferase
MAGGARVTAGQGADWRGMLALMRGDFARTVQECTMGTKVGRLRRLAHLMVPSAYCALLFRLAHLLHAKDWRRLAAMVTLANRSLCGVMLHPASVIGPGLFVPHPVGVTFCGRAGANLTIYPMGYVCPAAFPGWLAAAPADWPRLGGNVRIGTYAAVIGDVAVGDNAIVGVHVVIRTDLPAGLSAVVRPNWRTVRKPGTPAQEMA